MYSEFDSLTSWLILLDVLLNMDTGLLRPARTYIHQFCADTGWSLENLPGKMEYRAGRKKDQGNCASIMN